MKIYIQPTIGIELKPVNFDSFTFNGGEPHIRIETSVRASSVIWSVRNVESQLYLRTEHQIKRSLGTAKIKPYKLKTQK